MRISQLAINELVPVVNGDGFSPNRKGSQLVQLFNTFGARDTYDALGLPDIGKPNGQRPSRKEYTTYHLKKLLGSNNLRSLLQKILNELEDKESSVDKVNGILNPDGYHVILRDNQILLQGGIIDRSKPVVNEAHFRNIQNQILEQLDNAKVSICVVMAWFTNETLFAKLVEKMEQGLDVQLLIFDDGVNRKHGVDFSRLNCTPLKRGLRGGLMHDKFCIIDNQIVITGSYNWTNNAEHRNDENIAIEKDPEQATRYSVEFLKLKRDNLLKAS
jgi:PLD-like domain